MTTSPSSAATPIRATRAWTEGRTVWVALEDGRILGFPAVKFRRLRDASDELLGRVKIEARGTALRWEELDEDLTVDGILAGRWDR